LLWKDILLAKSGAPQVRCLCYARPVGYLRPKGTPYMVGRKEWKFPWNTFIFPYLSPSLSFLRSLALTREVKLL
jgi:hypothetical protein